MKKMTLQAKFIRLFQKIGTEYVLKVKEPYLHKKLDTSELGDDKFESTSKCLLADAKA